MSNFGRFIFVLLLLASSFVYAMFQGGNVSWTIFYILLPFACYSILLFFYPLSNLSVERTIHTPNLQKGGKLTVSIKMKRTSHFPLLYTVATERCEGGEYARLAGNQLKHLFIFGFRKEVDWKYEVDQMPRGEHVIQGVELELSDFFGWIRKKKFIDLVHTVLVYPQMVDLDNLPSDTQNSHGMMASVLSIIKETTMVTGLRDYQAGDRMSWIHWKTFARTQNLMTKEFEDKRSQQLCLILDGRQSETFEGQVELSASVLREASRQQSSITFMTTGARLAVFPFIHTEEQFLSAFAHLAKIEPTMEGKEIPSFGGGMEIQSGGLIVLITGNPDGLLLQSVLGSVSNARSILCIVVDDGDSQNPTLEDNIRIARSKGIKVYRVGAKQFPEAFKEVAG